MSKICLHCLVQSYNTVILNIPGLKKDIFLMDFWTPLLKKGHIYMVTNLTTFKLVSLQR